MRQCSSHTMCHVSCVICHLSRVTCHLSPARVLLDLRMIYGHLFSAILHRIAVQSRTRLFTPSMIFSRPGAILDAQLLSVRLFTAQFIQYSLYSTFNQIFRVGFEAPPRGEAMMLAQNGCQEGQESQEGQEGQAEVR